MPSSFQSPKMMFEKPRPNHREYIQVLRRMTPEQRLAKAFELSELTKRLFREGMRKQFPELSEEDFHQLYLERLAKCHNRNY
jgi:23S rRNA A2030 N6-methylase RlmJ